jgi:hypothetical protein
VVRQADSLRLILLRWQRAPRTSALEQAVGLLAQLARTEGKLLEQALTRLRAALAL